MRKTKTKKPNIELVPDHLKKIIKYSDEFEKVLARHNSLIKDLKSLVQYSRSISELKSIVGEIYRSLNLNINGSWTIEDLEFELSKNVYESLDCQLECIPFINLEIDNEVSEEVNVACDDFNNLIERIFDEIRESGFNLCHALSGAI